MTSMQTDPSAGAAGEPGSQDLNSTISDAALPAAVTLPSSATVTVSAARVREGLHLTPHQLGEYTKRLGLSVGDRPNYPRFAAAEIHALLAVQSLRDLQVPLEDACQAVAALRASITAGQGWVVLYRTPHQWVAVSAGSVEALLSLLTLTTGAVILDLAAVGGRARAAWHNLTDQAVGVLAGRDQPVTT